METRYWIAGAVVAVIGAGAVSMAIAKQGGQGPWSKMVDVFAEFDANSDGKVTLDEMEQSKKARFASADSNGDSLISSDEAIAHITAEMAKRMSDRVERYIERHDGDGDGLLSYGEIDMWQMQDRIFARVDADGDGVVTKEEFTDATAHRRAYQRGGRWSE